MPLLRITCPPADTDRFVEVLIARAEAREVSVLPGVSRITGGDLILADVPRHVLDDLLAELGTHDQHVEGLFIGLEASERIYPDVSAEESDHEAVVWAEVEREVHALGRLSWINTLLILAGAMIAAIGLIEDQLLLIVGAMALSPDYYPIAMTSLGVVNRDRRRVLEGLGTTAVLFAVGAAGALVLTEVLVELDVVSASTVPSSQLTLFVSHPNTLSVVVAVVAGVAGALAVTLPDARGIVGVFVSITTIPAAADIGVAIAAGDRSRLTGATVQLLANVFSLLAAGVITLSIRRRFPKRFGASRGRTRAQTRHLS